MTSKELWENLVKTNEIKTSNGIDYIFPNKDINIKNFGKILRLEKKNDKISVKYISQKTIKMTDDHVMTLLNGKDKLGKELKLNDEFFDGYKISNIKKYSQKGYSYDVTTSSEHFMVNGIYSHNCRSFLTPDPVNHKSWGRFNQGVVTISLPDVALSSKKDMEKFWLILNERLELCHRALRLRHEHLRGVKSNVAPILWQHGAINRLKPGETIDKLLMNNYSTISLGYVGLYETVKYLTGKNHWEDGEGLDLAKQIMQALNDACSKWREVEHISYSLYGTPEESTTYKFAKSLQRRFGIIKGITDKNYVTNSYHIPVFQEIDAFSKIKAEAQLQELSPGGAISYVEVPNMNSNPEAIIELLKCFYDNIMYAEINSKSDYCMNCGYDGEIELIEDENKKLIWKCPQCGCTDHSKMIIVRRVCGYLGQSQNMNQGRLGDIHDRVLHL